MEIITEYNFKQIAEKYYDNPQCFALKEFEQDVRRFNHVATLLDKFARNSVMQERLLLNHIIILHNTFGKFTAAGLFYKTDQAHWPVLKTFLNFLKYIPEDMPQYYIQDNVQILEKLHNL